MKLRYLSFTESGAGTGSVYDCGEGDPAEGSFRLTTGSVFVPVILSAAGQNQSFFTSELTLTNRREREERLDYLYTAHIGGGSGTASEVLAPGVQKIETDALGHLRGLGIPIPETGNRIGTLWVEVRLGSEVEAVVRTTTVVPEGRAGLAYLGVAEEEGFSEVVYLCGLRQNIRDRSNVAFQNMGAEEEGAITLRTTVYSGEAGDTSARNLGEISLEPGGFHQYSPVLGDVANGYVKVERVEGTAPFHAYGVINDQANSDGSFVFPVEASSLEGRAGQTLPVIVETSEFRSELTVTNFSDTARTLDFQFVAEGIKTDDKTASFSMKLEAGGQKIIPHVLEELRRQGVAGLGSTRGFYAGPLFAVAAEGDMSGIVIGARTGSQGGGGSYSVFYNAVPEGGAFAEVAWVDGLQQNEENRSNLALVNTGEVDGSASVFHLEIYDGETGLLAETVVTKPIPARGWHQINGILGSYARVTGRAISGSGRCRGRTRSWPTEWSTTAGPRESAAATGLICRPGSRSFHEPPLAPSLAHAGRNHNRKVEETFAKFGVGHEMGAECSCKITPSKGICTWLAMGFPGTTTLPDNKSRFLANFAKGSEEINRVLQVAAPG